ncbi:MAG: hypothetical protein K2W96_04710, partial [Gemmataceae bacterium]|nr:hypothetical protein [Gemmataceae bacterium]
MGVGLMYFAIFYVRVASNWVLLPLMVSVQGGPRGGVRTVSTVQAHHPRACPQGLFEYQHAAGDTLAQSARAGFDGWAQLDWPALRDSLLPGPGGCMLLEMQFPEKDELPARRRRAVLGPTAHYMANPTKEAEAAGEEHSFCPCCLLTKSFEAFKPFFESEAFVGLRLYAARSDEGPLADCRANGDDYEEGMAALREYVGSWPGTGYEFRKQYVVLHDLA